MPSGVLGEGLAGLRPLELGPVLHRVHDGAHQQRVAAEPHVALLHVAIAVHQAVANVHPDTQHGALGGVGALAGLEPLRRHGGVCFLGLLKVVRVILHVGEGRSLRLCQRDLAAETPRRGTHSPPPARLREKVDDLRGASHGGRVAECTDQEDGGVEARDVPVVEDPEEDADGHDVEDDIAVEGEPCELQRQVRLRGGQDRRPDDDQNVEDLSADDGADSDVGGVEDGDRIQSHLGPVATQRHQRGTSDVVGDLEALADDVDGAHEVDVADVRHAPEEVEDHRPPEPPHVRDVEGHDAGCQGHGRGRLRDMHL
mmetsp:Transcript_1536/g.3414  ORF Transcript_1536/g.3414 Transcript_1536/m.3414 type:complete len:313 (+) Transcript_1536:704-1642(+)